MYIWLRRGVYWLRAFFHVLNEEEDICLRPPHAATFHMLFAHKTSIQALQFEAWDWSRDS